MRMCCVPNCYMSSWRQIFHRFPRQQEVFDDWIRRIASPRHASMSQKKIFNNDRVCDRHFSHWNKDPNTKQLRIYSTPTIAVPGFDGIPNKKNSFCLWHLEARLIHKSGESNSVENGENNGITDTPQVEALIEHGYCKVKGFDEEIKNMTPSNTNEVVNDDVSEAGEDVLELGEVIVDDDMEVGEVIDNNEVEVGEIVKGVIDLHYLPCL